jgi:surface polysaccharide O-acyltransferase-like enzyme
MRERNLTLDLTRIIACLMVVLMHSPRGGGSMYQNALYYVTAPCIGLFFITSGALLLPVELDTFSFLKKRLTKILIPSLIWTAFYVGIHVIPTGDVHAILRSIFSIPFSPQGTGVLWFIYTLVGLYLVAPIISKWLSTCCKSELEFYMLIWGITLCYPIFDFFLEVRHGDTSILYYFTGYLGYFILGYYLNKYPKTLSLKVVIPFFMIALIVPIICKLKQICDFGDIFWYLSIFVVTMCLFWYYLADKLSKRIAGNKLIVELSNLSFGVYLIHIFIMRDILWNTNIINSISSYEVRSIIVAVLTITISYTVSFLISKTKIAKYLIGYKSK